ncbi:tRNA guanosine(34) transglycosylase Tgt [Candidatus Binatia bacterium]|nr:tRNA guanosine(34) transglycosylase Tgt [Candidatus Binatia bacterium]
MTPIPQTAAPAPVTRPLPDDLGPPGTFATIARAPGSDGRRATLVTAHGVVDTPAFMPVATQATVKGLTPSQLRAAGVQILLANAYHLAQRPGTATIRDCGGLHRFMAWDGPILTDSGGYQIFSLAPLRTVTDAGVTFRSHLDGSRLFLSPEDALRIQADLGVDIAMVLDECVAADAPRAEVERAAVRTLAWARRSRDVVRPAGQMAFAIVQGGLHVDLRIRQAAELVALDFPGYAVGGLSVGEDREVTWELAAATTAALPDGRPRYLMGVGLPDDLIRFVGMGFDLFDCVLPTRNGRNGMLFTARGRLNVRLARYANDEDPPDSTCSCYVCRSFSRAYLRHLATTNEMLGATLASLHNVHFYQALMADMRAAIAAGTFAAWAPDRIAELSEGT